MPCRGCVAPKVHVELSLADDGTGNVAAFGHEVEACALGQASSSVMAREIIGSTPQELRQVGAPCAPC